jgi:hypothetical protein
MPPIASATPSGCDWLLAVPTKHFKIYPAEIARFEGTEDRCRLHHFPKEMVQLRESFGWSMRAKHWPRSFILF